MHRITNSIKYIGFTSLKWVYLLFFFSAISLVIINLLFNLINPVILFLGIIGAIYLLIVFIKPEIGFFVTMSIPFIMETLQRYFMRDFPIGSIVDGSIFYLLIVLIIKRRNYLKTDFKGINNFFTFMVIIFVFWSLIQLFNPNRILIDGWIKSLRYNSMRVALFAVAYMLFSNKYNLKLFIYSWLFFGLISALYACYTEWFGFPDWESRWIHADQKRLRLIFNWGHYRKFSFFSNPATFGLFMAVSSLFSIYLFIYAKKLQHKLILLILTIFMLVALSYSGTRTAYAMIPAGFALYLIFTANSYQALSISLIVVSFMAFIFFAPIHGNGTINRIQSTFDFEDESLDNRNDNRKRVQPYIHNNLFGGGHLSCGFEGHIYNPGHVLAGIPPDSAYLKTALEVGWPGLLILLLYQFAAIKMGINRFFSCRNNLNKALSMSLASIWFSLCIAAYAQVSIGQYQIIFFVNVLVIIVSKLNEEEHESSKVSGMD